MKTSPNLQQQLAAMPFELTEAHAHSIRNRSEILSSAACGCYHCCQRFPSNEVSEWCDEGADGVGQTALCPNCGIDSVIADAAGFVLSQDLLTRMKARWF